MARVTPQYCNVVWHDAAADAQHPGLDHVCNNVRGHDSIRHGPCAFCSAKER